MDSKWQHVLYKLTTKHLTSATSLRLQPCLMPKHRHGGDQVWASKKACRKEVQLQPLVMRSQEEPREVTEVIELEHEPLELEEPKRKEGAGRHWLQGRCRYGCSISCVTLQRQENFRSSSEDGPRVNSLPTSILTCGDAGTMPKDRD
eukprot:1735436-Amphidinium_carterae.1